MTPELPIEGEGQSELPRPAYDVCTPDRLPAERVAFVDAVHQEFLTKFAHELSVYLDTPVEPVVGGVDQTPVSRFLEGGAGYACTVILELSPMRGQAWVGLSGSLVFRILDVLMGAPQSAAPAGRATVTDIEQHVLREFFESLAKNLNQAWAPSGVSMRLGSIGGADDVRKSADPDGTALVLACKLKMGENEDSFRVAVPVLAVRLAVAQAKQAASTPVSRETAERMARLEAVGSAGLEVEAVLRGSAIRLGDLAGMQAGQVLMLGQPAGSQLECLVNGKSKYRGEWIAHGDRHGLQVDALVEVGLG